MAAADPDLHNKEKYKIDPHLLRYCQTALAVAIIKRTPAGQTPEQYAETLCAQHRRAQIRWKDKATTLRQEVLLLRQQLLKQKWSEDGIPIKSSDGPASQEASDPYLTPPCSSEDPLDLGATGTGPHSQEALLSRHASFLQSVLALSTVANHGATERGIVTRGSAAKTNVADSARAATIDPVFEETAQESVQAALITLGDLLTSSDGPSISGKMAHHMVQVITNIVDSRRFSQYLSNTFCDMVLCFAWGIISSIVSNTGKSPSTSDRLSSIVPLLARSPILRPPVIQMLATQVVQISNHLREVIGPCRVPLNEQLFQNAYHIFHALEVILDSHVRRQETCLDLVFCRGLYHELDSSLRHIWEIFQPFAQYVWHIQGLVQCVHPGQIMPEGDVG